MKRDWSFPKRILITLCVAAAVAVYPLMKYGTPEILIGILAGCAISLLNVIFGYLAMEYAFDKPNKTFMKAVLGGMGIRLLLTLTLILVLIMVYEIHIPGFIGSLLLFYFVFLLFEVLYFNKKISLRK
jgi:F0F1-type ATP synthase assembly protein I